MKLWEYLVSYGLIGLGVGIFLSLPFIIVIVIELQKG